MATHPDPITSQPGFPNYPNPVEYSLGFPNYYYQYQWWPYSLSPTVSGWTVVGQCPKCGMPIYAKPPHPASSASPDQFPVTQKSCNCPCL